MSISLALASDHAIPWIYLDLTTEDEEYGKGYWKINNDVLEDEIL